MSHVRWVKKYKRTKPWLPCLGVYREVLIGAQLQQRDINGKWIDVPVVKEVKDYP